ncbi:MAG: Fe2+-dependent dioxygenase [Steroidobacteraceae bacterium]
MLLRIPEVLTADEVLRARERLQAARWADGRITAGDQSAKAKNNTQLPEEDETSQALQPVVLHGLQRNPLFFSATLPKQVSPPLFNRYGGDANSFGNHVDGAVRYLRDGSGRIRTDISCTVFLSDPDAYDGGELVVEDTFGDQKVKFAAGDAVIYPSTSVHRVLPVTRGARLGAYFWIQSMVRSDEKRRLLYDMDMHLIGLRNRHGETDAAIIGLTGTYHNLLRLWVDT